MLTEVMTLIKRTTRTMEIAHGKLQKNDAAEADDFFRFQQQVLDAIDDVIETAGDRNDTEVAAVKLSQAFALQRGVLAGNASGLSADEKKLLGEAEMLVRQASTLLGWIALKAAEGDA